MQCATPLRGPVARVREPPGGYRDRRSKANFPQADSRITSHKTHHALR